MTVQPISLFTGSVRACWVTTYNLEPGTFDSFLLPRLGEPPLNAVVLADQHRVDDAVDGIPIDESWRVGRMNRRWLLRPMNGGGAFHPKSILMVTRDRATLLVGSGNLTLSGLDRGHESFSTYRSDEPEGCAALATWLNWMRRLVATRTDPILQERFDALLRVFPPLAADPTLSPLLHNLDRSLIDQIVERLPTGTASELHLAAPFHDPDGAAIDSLLNRLQPSRVVIYLAEGSKVDGHALASVLARHENVEADLLQYVTADDDPVAFVHAKLLAATWPNNQGVVIGGSANLSRAALLGSGTDPWANIELATVAVVTADRAVGALLDEGRLATRRLSIDSLSHWAADYEAESAPPMYRIHRATRQPDGTVELDVSPMTVDELLLSDGLSAEPAATARPAGPLVWLTDALGAPVSNRIALDDPAELAAQLGERSSGASTTPDGLAPDDLETPLGGLLLYLHRHIIMDVAETEAIALANRATEGGIEAGDDLWEVLATEQLRRDPRVSSYTSILNRTGTDGDELTALLSAMLAQAPETLRNAFSNVFELPLPTPEPEPDTGDAPNKKAWSATARVRVRLRNVLRRWIAALGDERLTWVDPDAPLVNTVQLVDALVWLAALDVRKIEVGLDSAELLTLTRSVLDAAIDVLDVSSPQPEKLPQRTAQLLAAAAIMDTRSGSGRRARILAWQPVLRRAGWLVESGSTTVEVLRGTNWAAADEDAASTALDEIREFIDDKEWSMRVAADLGLDAVRLMDASAFVGIEARATVAGIGDPITDPRTVPLVLELRRYRNASRIVLEGAGEAWRLVFVDAVQVRHGAKPFRESIEPLDWMTIEELNARNAPLSSLFDADARVA